MQGAPSSYVRLPDVDLLREKWLGVPVTALPTPAVLIDRHKMLANIAEMQRTVTVWQCLFRAHIKTHKTREGVCHQLAQSKQRAIVVSTFAEAWGVVESGLLDEGVVDDILHGLPIGVHKMEELVLLRRAIRTRSPSASLKVLVDNIAQVEALQQALQGDDSSQEPLSVYIKIDSGYQRAGLTAASPALRALVEVINASSRVAIWGVYCHAGNSYSSESLSTASSFLTTEVQCTNEAAQVVQSCLAGAGDNKRHRSPLVLSVGSTPTAHAARSAPSIDVLCRLRSELHGELELHAGNYPFLDLQQLATGAVASGGDETGAIGRCAMTVLASVLSVYPGRGATEPVSSDHTSSQARLGDEALCDAGGMALSKDTGRFDGYGHVISPPSLCGWKVARVAQEHGILALRQGSREQWASEWGCSQSSIPAESSEMVRVGDRVQIVPQHACMVAAAHPFLFVVDSSRSEQTATVQDVWIPWKGW